MMSHSLSQKANHVLLEWIEKTSLTKWFEIHRQTTHLLKQLWKM